jgi:hypothetical protein
MSHDSTDKKSCPSSLSAAVGVNKSINPPISEQVTSGLHLDSDVILGQEGNYDNTNSINVVLPANSRNCDLENSCATYIPSQMETEEVSGSIIGDMAPTDGSRNKSPLDGMHVYGIETSEHKSRRSTSNVSANRPLLPKNLQTKGLELGRSPRNLRDPHAIKPRPSNPSYTAGTRPGSKCRNEVFRTPSASEMIDILKVTVDSEEEKRRVSNAVIEKQGSQITDLVTRNSALQQEINGLKQNNLEMAEKLSGFKDRCAAYKAHMNQVTEGQRALWEQGEELKRARDDLLALLQDRDRQNFEAQAKFEEVKSLFSAKARKTWMDASQRLVDRKQ